MNLFWIHVIGCDCDVGGAYDQFCDVSSGQCNCRVNVDGRDCSRYGLNIHDHLMSTCQLNMPFFVVSLCSMCSLSIVTNNGSHVFNLLTPKSA